MKAVAVQAFACGICRRLRRSKAKAESCCRCRCGRAVCSRWIDRCEACGKRNAIRRAKAEVRRETVSARIVFLVDTGLSASETTAKLRRLERVR